MSMLEELNKRPVERFRQLDIRSLDLSKEPEDTEELRKAIERLPQVLSGALNALKGLRSVK